MRKIQVPKYLIFRPAYRHLIFGSTGSGKTTLSSLILRNTHFAYPAMRLIIVDPNEAYIAGGYEKTVREVFPEGLKERIHGDVTGTLVNADDYKYPDKGQILIIHNIAHAIEFYHWVMVHATAHNPIFIHWDESLDSHTLGGKLIPPVRTILQQGRRRGIGAAQITQRTNRIDQAMISESDYVYAGYLNNDRDRERIASTLALTREYRELVNGYEDTQGRLIKVKKHCFVYVDQSDDSKAEYFTLNMKDIK